MVGVDSWTGFANRLRIGKGWVIVRQDDATYTVGVSWWAQTDYTSYNYDVTLNCYFGSHTKRLSGSNPMEMCYHEYTFSKTYGKVTQWTWGANASGTGAGPISGAWTGDIPARPYVSPGVPGSLSATPSSDGKSVAIKWSAPSAGSASLDQVNIQIGTSSSSPTSNENSTQTWRTSWSESSLTPGTKYYWRVRARNAHGQWGGWTSVQSFTATVQAPSAPATPTVSGVSKNSAKETHKAPSSNGGSAITGYNVEWSTSGGTVLETASVTGLTDTSPTLTPNTAYRVRVRAKNASKTSAWSGYAPFTTTVDTPTAPSTPTVTRTSDTSHTITWSRNASSTKPYASQSILRRIWNNGTWGSFSAVGSVSTAYTSTGTHSFTDTGTVANRIYQYQVSASNAAGTATSGGSRYTYTTPAGVSAVAAQKDASGNIVITWSGPYSTRPGHLQYEIQESTDGGSTWGNLNTSLTTETYTHSSPNTTVTHIYRVRSKIVSSGDVGNGLLSGYTNSNSVQLLTPPNAPTNLTQTPTGTVDRSKPVTLKWKHNPLDATVQTKFQVQHRELGASTWTTVPAVSSATASWTLPADTYSSGSGFEWQVMTWGLHATGSPWSATSTVSVTSAPSATVNFPSDGEVIGTSTLYAEWSFFDPDGDPQAAWEVTLLAADGLTTLQTLSGADDATTASFTVRIQDETAYTVRLRLRDSAGLWSEYDTVDISVKYALPPKAVVDNLTWDGNQATVNVQFTVPAPQPGEADVDRLEVWRKIDDGEFALLANDLTPDAFNFLDRTPTVEGRNTYVIQAVSSIPSVSQSDTQMVTRRNLVVDPRATDANLWAQNFGTGGAGTETMVTDASDGPILPDGTQVTTYARSTWTTAPTGTAAEAGYEPDFSSVLIPVGSVFATSIYVRASVDLQVRAGADGEAGNAFAERAQGPIVTISAGEWTRLETMYVVTAATVTGIRVKALIVQSVPVDTTVDVTCAMIEPGATVVSPYVDGYMLGATWDGEENASPSTLYADDPNTFIVTPQGDAKQSVWVSGGPGMAVLGRITWGVSVVAKRLRERVLRRYAGRTSPVEHSGDFIDETWDVSGELHTRWSREKDEPGSPEAWIALGSYPGPHLLRAPGVFGGPPIYEWVSLTGPTVTRNAGGNVFPVSFTATKMGE